MVRVRNWLSAVVMCGLVLTLTACGTGTNPLDGSADDGKPAVPLNIGNSLYKAAPMPPVPEFKRGAELVVIPKSTVQNDLRVQIPAQVDGLIELIATPLEPGEQCDPSLIVYHPRDPETDPAKKQRYRRLRENDIVRKGQILARLDEQLVDLQIQANNALKDAMNKAIVEAKNAVDAQEQLATLYKGLKTALSISDKLNNDALVARYRESWLQSVKELAKIEGELQTAKAQLARYWVRSPINGRVHKLLKSPQEYAKASEVIMEIQATDRIRVEGKLDAQYERLLKRGMKVTVEPARPISPDPQFHNPGHRLDVTSVAITGHPGQPLVVSGGLDGTALVWDPMVTKQSHRLPHPTGVRSVAATPPGNKVKPLVVTGGDDGKVRLWDLSNPNKLPREPITLEDSHGSSVTACAFSPDGRFLATTAGRDVFVWDVAARKRLYALPQEHRDAVTSVHFTPQATLITASRDKSVRVWKLGEQGASIQNVIDHRGGMVDVLGVSADGSKLLFDKDASRLDVVSLTDERSIGTLQTPGEGARFATLAVFSADDQFVLTAGGDADQRGELTLWEAPKPGGRGAEKMRLVTPRDAAVTCAAFSPDSKHKFMVIGTADGGVHLWTPSAAQQEKPLTGEVVSVLRSDARSVTVRVELENPTDGGEGLKDRSLATIIIDPSQPMPTTPAVPPPAGGGVRPIGATNADAGEVVQAGGVPMVPPVATQPQGLPPAAAPMGAYGPRVNPVTDRPLGSKK